MLERQCSTMSEGSGAELRIEKRAVKFLCEAFVFPESMTPAGCDSDESRIATILTAAQGCCYDDFFSECPSWLSRIPSGNSRCIPQRKIVTRMRDTAENSGCIPDLTITPFQGGGICSLIALYLIHLKFLCLGNVNKTSPFLGAPGRTIPPSCDTVRRYYLCCSAAKMTVQFIIAFSLETRFVSSRTSGQSQIRYSF